jgi:hypothetical protein
VSFRVETRNGDGTLRFNPMTNGSALYISAKAYVQAGVDLLAAAVPKAPMETLVGLRDWVRSGDSFVTRDREIPYWSPWNRGVMLYLGALHGLPEYKVYVQALNKDPIAARHVGIVVTTRGGQHVKAEELADRILWMMVERRGGFEFESTEFDTIFEHFEGDLRRESLGYVAVAPLPGFRSDVDSILLDPDFELAELSDTELS